jgi:hypothetical protein
MRVTTVIRSFCACLTLAVLPGLFAQQWEVGVLGGGSFYLNNSVNGSRGSGNAGFKPGVTAGAWIGHNSSGRLGGEIRYQFQRNDMKVSSGGSSYNFGGLAHSVQYDLLIHTRPGDEVVRPFFAIGGGIKSYRGIGTETAYQPLSNVAILSRTFQWMPMLSVGGGVKWAVGARTEFRVEVRDFVTPFPKDVILPSPGNKVSGWVHSLTPLFGVSYLF